MTAEATTVLYQATCARCGADITGAVTNSIREDGEHDQDGREIVTVVFHSLEILSGCEHAELVRDNCTIRLAAEPL